jgi:hypothetical protein
MKNNVIKFPKLEGEINYNANEELAKFKMTFIEEVTKFLTGMVFSELERANTDLDDDDIPDAILIAESIKSLMMKKHGFEHPLQEFSVDFEEMYKSDILEDTINDTLED